MNNSFIKITNLIKLLFNNLYLIIYIFRCLISIFLIILYFIKLFKKKFL